MPVERDWLIMVCRGLEIKLAHFFRSDVDILSEEHEVFGFEFWMSFKIWSGVINLKEKVEVMFCCKYFEKLILWFEFIEEARVGPSSV